MKIECSMLRIEHASKRRNRNNFQYSMLDAQCSSKKKRPLPVAEAAFSVSIMLFISFYPL
jgi:hypothetical protein